MELTETTLVRRYFSRSHQIKLTDLYKKAISIIIFFGDVLDPKICSIINKEDLMFSSQSSDFSFYFERTITYKMSHYLTIYDNREYDSYDPERTEKDFCEVENVLDQLIEIATKSSREQIEAELVNYPLPEGEGASRVITSANT